jgi:hypothetical protein
MLSIHFFKDTYYLRAHRVIIVFIRIYIVMFLGYLSHREVPSIITQNLAKIRDITLKPIRYDVYVVLKDFNKAAWEAFYYSLPASFVLTFFPKLTEFFFRYNEAELKQEDMKRDSNKLMDVYYPKVLSKNISKKFDQNVNVNIDKKTDRSQVPLKDKSSVSDFGKSMDDFAELNLFKNENSETKSKKFRTYLNFVKMTQPIIEQIQNDYFFADFYNNLPPELAPIYMQRLDGQMSGIWIKKHSILKGLDYKIQVMAEGKSHDQRPKANELFKDSNILMNNADDFMNNLQAVDVHQLDNVCI